MLRCRPKGEMIRARREKTGSMRGVLDAVRKGQRIRIIVQERPNISSMATLARVAAWLPMKKIPSFDSQRGHL